jgi:hypothetical protein
MTKIKTPLIVKHTAKEIRIQMAGGSIIHYTCDVLQYVVIMRNESYE